MAIIKYNQSSHDTSLACWTPNTYLHQDPSGEVAFKALHLELGYAKSPLIHRLSDLDRNIPITMIYGAQSWMDPTNGYRVQVKTELFFFSMSNGYVKT